MTGRVALRPEPNRFESSNSHLPNRRVGAPRVRGSKRIEANVHQINIDKLALSTRAVTLSRNGKVFARLPDLRASAGRSLAVVGVSGSGKTTALMALAGLRAPEQGMVLVEGIDIWALRARERDRFRGRHIGLVFQSFHLVDALSVSANVALASQCAGVKTDRVRLDQLLSRLGLQDVRASRADRISHGQAQRVAVLRALINRPALVLADEPTSALDDDNAAALLGLLKDVCADAGAALIVATHDRRVTHWVNDVVAMERVG